MGKKYVAVYLKVILIILMIVGIVFGIFHYLKKQYDHEKIETLKTDMLLIEGKIKIIQEKVNMKEKGASYVGIKIAEMKDNEQISNLKEKNIIEIEEEQETKKDKKKKKTEKKHEYYVLEKSHLEQLQLNDLILEEGYYIVDYKTEEVIYSLGIENKEGNLLYKLSDIKNIE